MIELDDLYWFPEKDPGITDISDPFSNLLDEVKLPRLLRDYDTWCLDIHICLLRESKAIGSSKARTGTRDSILLSRLQSSPNYKKNLRTQKSQGKREYERLEKEARMELRKMIRRYRDDAISFAELQRDTADFFEHFYGRMFEAGRKASGLDLYMPDAKITKGEQDWLKSSVREELKYWQSFLEEIKKGEVAFRSELDPQQLRLKAPRRKYTVEERLSMYLRGLEAVFENGRVSGMPPNLLFYWFGPKPGEKGICKGCEYIVERQPFTKATLPAVPRSGATPCLSRCRHRVVVREASLTEVANRRKRLPTRETMVKQLRSIQQSKPRHKVKGKLVNPWRK